MIMMMIMMFPNMN